MLRIPFLTKDKNIDRNFKAVEEYVNGIEGGSASGGLTEDDVRSIVNSTVVDAVRPVTVVTQLTNPLSAGQVAPPDEQYYYHDPTVTPPEAEYPVEFDAPTNVVGSLAFKTLVLSWDIPANAKYLKWRVYSDTVDSGTTTQSTKTLVDTIDTTVYTILEEVGVTKHYWVTAVNTRDTESTFAYAGSFTFDAVPITETDGVMEYAEGRVTWSDAEPGATGRADGDTWFDTNDGNKPYRWDSGTSTWVAEPLEKAAIGELDAGSIVAGSIVASKLYAGEVDADKITAANIAADTITAANLEAGTITSSSACITSLNADWLTAGEIVGRKIRTGAEGSMTGERRIVLSPGTNDADIEFWGDPENFGGVDTKIGAIRPYDGVAGYRRLMIVGGDTRDLGVNEVKVLIGDANGGESRFAVYSTDSVSHFGELEMLSEDDVQSFFRCQVTADSAVSGIYLSADEGLCSLYADSVMVNSEPLVPVWSTITLSNSWAERSGYSVDYLRDVMGVVRLRGVVENGTTNTICTLGTGYRPPYAHQFCCQCRTDGGVAFGIWIQIGTDGVVQISSSAQLPSGSAVDYTGFNAGGWISLDGISFSTIS